MSNIDNIKKVVTAEEKKKKGCPAVVSAAVGTQLPHGGLLTVIK